MIENSISVDSNLVKTSLTTANFYKKYLLANRTYLLLFSFSLILVNQIMPSFYLFAIPSIIITESFIRFILLEKWWRKIKIIDVLSNWERTTSIVLFLVFIIWGFTIFMYINGYTGLLLITVLSLIFSLILFHAEFIIKVQRLSRDFLLLMPNSEKKSKLCNLQHIVKTVSNEDDIVSLVKKAHREQQNIRVIGSRNSAQVYRIAPSNANSFVQLELEDNYNNVLNVDQENKRITIQSGMSQGKLISILKKYQWALNSINGSHLITVGGAIATGSFSASKFSYGDAILSLRIIEADGNIITVDRNHCNFGAYLCSNGLLGVISEITFQCVEEYSVRGKSSIVDFETMISFRDEDNLHFLEDWDYMICEWYPYIKKVVCRRSVQIPKLKSTESNEISSVGPSESYFGQLLTIIGGIFPLTNKIVISSYLKYLGTEFGDGFWGDRICADPKLSSTFHPIDYLEVVIPQRHYVAYMMDLKAYYEKHPERMPYGPVISDWIISDKHSWIGKNSHDQDEWFAAITFMRQQVEKKTAAYIFEGPVALAKKYDTRMHWGKNPWMDKKEDIAKTLRKGNLEHFSKLRKEKDPQGLFLNDFFKKVFI